MDIWGRGKSQCKGLKIRMCLEYSEESKQASVIWLEQSESGTSVKGEVTGAGERAWGTLQGFRL